MNKKRLFLASLFLAFTLFFCVGITNIFAQSASAEDLIRQKKEEIAALEQQIADYNRAIAESKKKGKTLQQEINTFNTKIKKAQAQIKTLILAIDQLEAEIKKTEGDIRATEKILEVKKKLLSVVVRNLYEKEQISFLNLLVTHASFFDFFNDLAVIDNAREEVRKTVIDYKETKSSLEAKKSTLNEQYEDQTTAKKLLEVSKKTLEQREVEKKTLLKETKGQEATFQKLLTLSKTNLDKLKSEIFYMMKAGITAEDALKYGQAVANSIGIRPAFLLAILEIESRLGASVGTGYYKKDMNPNQWNYFLDLMAKLGMNPETTPVSKKPSYGWGGAMGPAQFLPGTWLGWESKIASVTGHNPPSPWSIEDSFTAAALKLYNDGASSKTKTGELRAAKTYISGNPNCSKTICNYYANLAIDKAEDIEETLKNK